MNNVATVMLWGTTVGYFHLPEGAKYVSFEYDKDFVRMGVEISPLMMPISNRVYEFPDLVTPAFRGVPGLLADSLPDRFGNAVIDQWLASQGRTPESFNVVERLCYTGKRGMGALEYLPATHLNGDNNNIVDIAELVAFASSVLESRENIHLSARDDLTYKQLLKLGTSAGGARAKAIMAYNKSTGDIRSGQINLDPGYDYWLMKFDGVSKNGDHDREDVPEYTLIEYAYYLMAIQAGIDMSECELLEENGRKHFMTRRFDRVDGKKLHMQSLGAITHIDYNEPGLCSYEMAALTARKLGLPNSDIEQFYRRMVFNVLAVNQDDHVKNISFLMDRNAAWTLSPAYDVTFACDSGYKWLRSHQMSINGKRSNILPEDMTSCGQYMDLKTSRCKKIIEEVREAITDWPSIAISVGIREKTIQLISTEMRTRRTK
ncbi:MAG TPA: type II toxin-antitoxin system HipA family toxin [Clostridiaceae bacterium]|nr:type II toxin-antitoxin system HipA family toxin [Clostridiaceae bacterium]